MPFTKLNCFAYLKHFSQKKRSRWCLNRHIWFSIVYVHFDLGGKSLQQQARSFSKDEEVRSKAWKAQIKIVSLLPVSYFNPFSTNYCSVEKLAETWRPFLKDILIFAVDAHAIQRDYYYFAVWVLDLVVRKSRKRIQINVPNISSDIVTYTFLSSCTCKKHWKGKIHVTENLPGFDDFSWFLFGRPFWSRHAKGLKWRFQILNVKKRTI